MWKALLIHGFKGDIMTKKQKRRLSKSIARRQKELAKVELEKAWINIFVKNGILKD